MALPRRVRESFTSYPSLNLGARTEERKRDRRPRNEFNDLRNEATGIESLSPIQLNRLWQT